MIVKKSSLCALLGLTLFAAILTGCGGEEAEKMPVLPVKVMQVIQRDTPVTYNYAGQVVSKNEVAIHSKVSGLITEKYIKGGDLVHEGQPLYKIESRQYESELISAEANLHRAQANLRNAQEDLVRYEQLLASNAISEQTVTNQRANVASFAADVDSYAALARKAHENVEDTLVRAPMNGRVGVNDVAVGTYATAGATNLVSIGATDPIYVQFSVSESEYLGVVSEAMGSYDNKFKEHERGASRATVRIKMSNGKDYPFNGQLVEADRALGKGTGTLLIKALFPNPSGLLLSGMFAHVRLEGDILPNAVLVPQRAVQQLLDNYFVITVGDGNKTVSKPVKLGEKVGSYYIVTEGVTKDDIIVVEGLNNLQSGQEVAPTMVTESDMGFSLENSSDLVNRS